MKYYLVATWHTMGNLHNFENEVNFPLKYIEFVWILDKKLLHFGLKHGGKTGFNIHPIYFAMSTLFILNFVPIFGGKLQNWCFSHTKQPVKCRKNELTSRSNIFLILFKIPLSLD